jgi:hypothetical protein
VVRYEYLLRSWSLVCHWGCFLYGYRTEREADEALVTHRCQGMKP